MTDFQFLSPDGAVDVTLRTDYIGAAAGILGGENVTVHDIIGLSTDTDHVFVNLQKIKYAVSDFKSLAEANDMKLTAMPISKPGVENAVLQIKTLAAPTGFAATVVSASAINLAWTKSSKATGYIIERATNAGFTTGLVTTEVGDVAVLAVTGLTAATHYYFRIKAIAPNATISAGALDDDTTSA